MPHLRHPFPGIQRRVPTGAFKTHVRDSYQLEGDAEQVRLAGLRVGAREEPFGRGALLHRGASEVFGA